MSVKEHLATILHELEDGRQGLDEASLAGLVREVAAARHVFVAGAGRSGVAITGFANRLLHLGKPVSRVGDITSPHSAPGDLLVIGSGSGRTDSLVALAGKAGAARVRIALLTMDAGSPIADLADLVVVLPGSSPKVRGATGTASVQPMGSAFEQLCFLVYDAVVLELADVLGETGETMFRRHADLE